MVSATVKYGNPLISVVMAVFNTECYVAEAIDSILEQSYRHFEFIIVDDGSTDKSLEIIRRYAAGDARIRPLFLAHGGIARAVNAGVALAGGELIARMDSDDIALPERLAVQLAWMRETGVDICGSLVKRFGAQSSVFWCPETHAAIRHELLFRICLPQPAVIMRAHILKTHPYNEATTAEDYELWTRLAPHFRMGNVPQVLLQWRSHARQTHLLTASGRQTDLETHRRSYFQTLFPEATEKDYAVLSCLANRRAFNHLADLEKSGVWLVRLAQTGDHFLRQRMADRWFDACRLSAGLGVGCYRVYRRISLQIDDRRPRRAWLLAWLCAAGIAPGTRRELLLERIWNLSGWTNGRKHLVRDPVPPSKRRQHR